VSGTDPDDAVLFRDARILVMNKPSGLAVHRGWARDRDVALTRGRALMDAHVYAVHRLDRGTSGALLMTSDQGAVPTLQGQFARHEVEKVYVALVHRHPPAGGGVVDHPVRKGPKGSDSEKVDAVTEWARLGVSAGLGLVRCRPRTGRLHQIRRHLKHIHHPILGDTTYGSGKVNRPFRDRFGVNRLMLHAVALGFDHPDDGRRVRVLAPLPADFAGVLASLGFPTDAQALAGDPRPNDRQPGDPREAPPPGLG
jgi:tRNA pseudouridine65 synthase